MIAAVTVVVVIAAVMVPAATVVAAVRSSTIWTVLPRRNPAKCDRFASHFKRTGYEQRPISHPRAGDLDAVTDVGQKTLIV
ncbi:MAG TPA: hypothetical protein VMU05_07930 [Dongiaceae bacterium]|nr:hypothetical protein [Dongiaceae bacterium]